jgi:hypothetical protein
MKQYEETIAVVSEEKKCQEPLFGKPLLVIIEARPGFEDPCFTFPSGKDRRRKRREEKRKNKKHVK